MAPQPLSYAQIVFAAGGCRCLWQAGFWREVGPRLDRPPQRVLAVSAGSAIAALILAGAMDDALDYFKELTARNERNFYPGHLLRGRPPFPHEAMYRQAVLAMIDDLRFAALQAGPDLRVLLAYPPRWLPSFTAVVAAASCFEIESRLRGSPHHHFAARLGFRGELVSVRQCADQEALCALLLASSCTPPITPFYRRRGSRVIDGAVIDAAPVDLEPAPPGRSLVLLTKPNRRLPATPDRTYIRPSRPIPITKWDYTNPDGLQRAFDLGREDGQRFLLSRGRG